MEVLTANMGRMYTSEYIIQKHTILPYYLPFLPKFRREEILYDIKYNDCSGTNTKIGIVAGSVCKKDAIYYCHICAKNEIEMIGEAFIHREHQLQGVKLCAHHGVFLKKYVKDKKQESRLEFIRLQNDLLDLRDISNEVKYYEKMLKLAKDSYYLINANQSTVDKNLILEKYKNLLYERGLTTSSKNVKQNELYEEFINYYGQEFLAMVDSTIDNFNEYNWLRIITRDLKRVVHPIRHLLMINFLSCNINEFFKGKKRDFAPFGKAPWPCLNKIADHYMSDVVNDLKITEDYKTRLPVGTFTCDCGFVYSRKGPDKSQDDRYRIGRIKKFGSIWEDKLRSYLKEQRYGLRELARLMYCDPKTILKFDKIMKINYFDNNKPIIIKNKEKAEDSKLEEYKSFILKVLEKHTEASRTEIRELCKKQYIFVYRYDKVWLFQVLPLQKKKIIRNRKIDWRVRDNELLKLIKNKYEEILNLDTPMRITKSILGKSLGVLATIEKNLNNIPKTERYLKQIAETVEEFQLRRCKKLIKEKAINNQEIRLWEIQRLAAIRSAQFKKIKEKLKIYIDNEIIGG